MFGRTRKGGLSPVIAGLLAALVAAAYGCSGSSGSTSSEKVTLTYGIWDKNQAPAMQDIISAFHASHPNIDVTVSVTPWDEYWTKLEAAATGGAMPDVVWMNGPHFPKYASAGVISPIGDDAKRAHVDLANYPASLISLYSYNNKLYGLPKDFDTIGLYYNKELFKAAGAATPTADWTWNDVVDAAKKLTDSSKGVWGIGARLTNQEGYYDTIFQAGGYVISPDGKRSGFDDPAAVRGLEFWTDMILKYKVSPTQKQMTDTDPVQMFESGKLAMLYAGSWSQVAFAKNEYTRDRVDVAVLPKGETRATVIHGLGNVISAKTKHRNEAWEFVKFLGSEEAANIEAKTGTVIPAFKGTQSAWVTSNPKMHLQVFIDQLAYAKPFPVSKDADKWLALETKIFTKAWTGEVAVPQATKQMATEMNAILSAEK